MLLKKDVEPSAMLDPPFRIYVNIFNFTYKRINRSNRHREIDLCIKECLGSEKKKKKNPQVLEFLEKLTAVKN